MKNLRNIFCLVLTGLLCYYPASSQINYFDDFESYTTPADMGLLGGGWKVGALVWADNARTAYVYDYFTFDASNGTPAFASARSTNEDGNLGGCNNQYLNAYSDYNNVDHAAGRYIDAYLFQEQTITASDIGTYTFSFDHRLTPEAGFTPDISSPDLVELRAFVQVLNPATGFSTTYFDSYDTSTAADWTHSNSLSIAIDPTWENQLVRWGFNSYATNYAPTGVWYDNISFAQTAPAPNTPAACPAVSAGDIPTLGEWGLICLSVLMVIFGLNYMRQRQSSIA